MMTKRAEEVEEEAKKHTPKIHAKPGEEVKMAPPSALAEMGDVLDFK